MRRPLNEEGLQGGHLGTLWWVQLEGPGTAWHLVLTVSSGLCLPSVGPMSAGQFTVRPRDGPVLAGLQGIRRQASVCAWSGQGGRSSCALAAWPVRGGGHSLGARAE